MKRPKIEEMFYNVTDQTGMETVVIDVDDLRPFIKYSDWLEGECKTYNLTIDIQQDVFRKQEKEIKGLKEDVKEGQFYYEEHEKQVKQIEKLKEKLNKATEAGA